MIITIFRYRDLQGPFPLNLRELRIRTLHRSSARLVFPPNLEKFEYELDAPHDFFGPDEYGDVNHPVLSLSADFSESKKEIDMTWYLGLQGLNWADQFDSDEFKVAQEVVDDLYG